MSDRPTPLPAPFGTRSAFLLRKRRFPPVPVLPGGRCFWSPVWTAPGLAPARMSASPEFGVSALRGRVAACPSVLSSSLAMWPQPGASPQTADAPTAQRAARPCVFSRRFEFRPRRPHRAVLTRASSLPTSLPHRQGLESSFCINFFLSCVLILVDKSAFYLSQTEALPSLYRQLVTTCWLCVIP